MQLKIWLVFGALFLASCKTGPAISRCVVEHDSTGNEIIGSWCAHTSKPDKVEWRAASEMENWTAMSPDDERTVLEWIKRNCKEK